MQQYDRIIYMSFKIKLTTKFKKQIAIRLTANIKKIRKYIIFYLSSEHSVNYFLLFLKLEYSQILLCR